MFVVLTYDINAKRVSKILRICRKYLVHIQKSVFEGNITEAKLNSLKRELKKLLKPEEDSIVIYASQNSNNVTKEQIGIMEDTSNII